MARTKRSTFTNELIETPVTSRTNFYDDQTSGLYVSVRPTGTASFVYKFWNSEAKKQQTVTIGTYDRDVMNVDKARAAVAKIIATGSAVPTQTAARAVAAETAPTDGLTFGKMVAMYIDHIKGEDDEKEWKPGVARVETWKQNEEFLSRPVKAWGHLQASAVTAHMIADLLKSVRVTRGKKRKTLPNVIRLKLSTMFNWAADIDREYVPFNPCDKLGKDYRKRGKAKTRVLSPDEIKTLWHGLDHPDCPGDRLSQLALKLILTTMLRPNEVCTIEIGNINVRGGIVMIPQALVKNRTADLHQPLSTLALEVMREAYELTERSNSNPYLFKTKRGHMDRASLSSILSRKSRAKRDGVKPVYPGIIEFLGMQKFTPHDLRRTAATIAGELNVSNAVIAKCLNHTMVYTNLNQQEAREEQAPAVTSVYNRAQLVDQRADALEAVADRLREIIGQRPVTRREIKLLTAA